MILLYFILSVVYIFDFSTAEISVTNEYGKFLGSEIRTRRDRPIYSYLGIRYAKAPIGELRFQPPKEILTYNEVVNGTVDGPGCPQPVEDLTLIDEDCLRINVHTPYRNPDGQKLLPILFYLHPGGFYSVSGQTIYAGPKYLLDHDVILVTSNYRLGSLGFISTGDELAPGNNGFKDQVAALKWVQRNIRAFGGDPQRVTIIGYSAGGMSVALHMMSDMSIGLFHQAVSMSSAPTAQWVIPHHQFNLAQKQAQLLNCSSWETSQEIMSCLRDVPYIEFANTLQGFTELGTHDPVLIWYPVIEPDLGQERFLKADPVHLIKTKNFTSVPLITGMTELEFLRNAFFLLEDEALSQYVDENYSEAFPIMFQYRHENSAYISRCLREKYLGKRSFSYNNDTIFALGRLYADAVIGFSVHRLATLMAKYSDHPVRYYKFSYKGVSSHLYWPNTTESIGAVHHDDLLMFLTGAYFPLITLNDTDSHMVDIMTTIWTNFATYGDPNPRDHQELLQNIHWPVLTKKNKKYLNFNVTLTVEEDLYGDRFAIWDELFPLIN